MYDGGPYIVVIEDEKRPQYETHYLLVIGRDEWWCDGDELRDLAAILYCWSMDEIHYGTPNYGAARVEMIVAAEGSKFKPACKMQFDMRETESTPQRATTHRSPSSAIWF